MTPVSDYLLIAVLAVGALGGGIAALVILKTARPCLAQGLAADLARILGSSAGVRLMMTLEERADLIAQASPYVPDTIVWKSLREHALQQLTLAAAHSWREGYGQGIAIQRGEAA